MIDTRYRTIPDRGARAIGGMSMGGHGALQLAMNHPEEFGIVGAHSIALRRQDQAFDFFGRGPDYASRDPVSLCEAKAATARSFTLWIDIGANDPWSGAAQAFHQQLASEQIPHRWSLNPGGHNDAYWSAHVRDYLAFYGQAFARNLGHGSNGLEVKAQPRRMHATVTGA
jgi:enterochelin esterase-like enzyme